MQKAQIRAHFESEDDRMIAPCAVTASHRALRVYAGKPSRDLHCTAQPFQKECPRFDLKSLSPSVVVPGSASLATGNVGQHIVRGSQLLAVASAQRIKRHVILRTCLSLVPQKVER